MAVLLLVGTLKGIPAETSDLNDEQARVLEIVRSSALQYSQNLPNFICTQITHRTVSADVNFGTSFNGASSTLGGTGIPVASRGQGGVNDVIEEQLTYFDEFEHYEVVTVNGKKAGRKRAHGIWRGHQCRRIRNSLHNLFDPRSHATFSWDKAAKSGGRNFTFSSFRCPARTALS